ncbi:MAG TPA: hypothetical protein VFO26_15390 [Gaiella sp.]|uniref:hypothetical protein n=1 Tax=Gaiella sp. TaxID=2663207 RepID=UPI002D81080F|nr:hypothetical protein [Gaiella sp.]HET9288938.1 hypothetical protein [Gaiella sp.]
MPFRRLLVLVSVTSSFLAVAPTVTAGSLDECAERVIRDWYSGGRVDGVYPLPCYRAAISALPDDVLQYSDADRDIARALEYARRGRSDPGNGPPGPAAAEAPTAEAERDTRAETEAEGAPQPVTGRADHPPVRGATKKPARLASEPAEETQSAGLPLPVIVLAALSGVLLASGAAGWLAARRR